MSHPNDENTRWISLADLLSKKIDVGTLATAIEKESVYTWDRFGRMVRATKGDGNDPYSQMAALDLLALVYKSEQEASEDEQSGGGYEKRFYLDTFIEDYQGPLVRFGWPSDKCPDFAAYKLDPKVPRAVSQTGSPDHDGLLLRRELTSIDIMIKALIKMAKITPDDVKQPWKIAGVIAKIIQENDESLSEQTIVKHLKRIFPQA